MDITELSDRIKERLGSSLWCDLMGMNLEVEQFVKVYNLIMDASDIGYADGYDDAERDHR